MKARSILLAAILVAIPFAATAEDADTTEGYVEIGGRAADVTDSPTLAGEYLTADDGVVLDLSVATHQDWGSLFVDIWGVDPDEAEGSLDFDVKRMVRSHTSYISFLHRLGHRGLEHLEATSINGKVVFHTDFNPGFEYDYVYEDLFHRTELQLPNLPALTLAVEFREQQRSGHAQAFTTSHCDTCHVKSQKHRIDEETTDGTIEAAVGGAWGRLRAAFTSRELTHGTPSVTVEFDNAVHPELQAPVFDNRLQYDDDVGPVPADLWPDIDKETSRLDLTLADLAGFAINAGGVWSETENRYTGLKSDYTGYVVNAARRLGDAWRIRWRGRAYSIDNDDVFVDTVERVSQAGPHAGQTYEDIYGVNYDWWRLSALDRDVFESKLDASWRLGKAAGTLRFLWDLETVDRDNYEVLPGETETTTNIFGASWRSRPAKGAKLEAAYRHAEIDNPYMLVNGACSTLESPRYDNPWNPDTPQYDDFHQARIAETTASPGSWDELRLMGSLSLGTSAMVSATYRWWEGNNDDGDLTDWTRTNQNATLTLWSAPAASWDWYVAYSWLDSELDAPACIPIFDG